MQAKNTEKDLAENSNKNCSIQKTTYLCSREPQKVP
jgi:hypothetical protein